MGTQEVVCCHGFEQEPEDSTAIMNSVRRRGKPRLVVDKIDDSRLRSAVCVPIKSENDRLVGLLYIDSPVEVTNYQYRDLNRLEEFARALAVHLDRILTRPKLPEMQVSAEPSARPTFLLVSLVVFLSAGGWLLFGLLRHTPSSAPEPTFSPVSQETLHLEDPLTAARFFQVVVRRGDYRSGYLLLSSRLQSRLTEEQFRQLMQSWAQTSPQLFTSEPKLLKGHEDTVELGQVRWKLVEEGELGWKLDRSDGAVSFDGSI